MISALLTGLFLGLSLIVAIGAQNAFILRQAILKQNVLSIAIFCSVADSLLIVLGVVGISYFFNDFVNEYSKIIFGLASLWLFSYGAFRLRSLVLADSKIILNNSKAKSLVNSLSTIAIFTFLNPHVYLDTIILIGSISQQFNFQDRIYFSFGACSASFIWFFSLAYGAKILNPLINKPSHWRTLDLLIATIMFIIAVNLAQEGGWF